jgi:protocatechuate 3,4-dioxygenase beta subunit
MQKPVASPPNRRAFPTGAAAALAGVAVIVVLVRSMGSPGSTKPVAVVSAASTSSAPRTPVSGFETRNASIRGFVGSTNGDAVVGARVCAYRVDVARAEKSEMASFEPACGVTGEDGAYAITDLAPAAYALSGTAPRFQPARFVGPRGERSLLLASGEAKSPIDLILEAGAIELKGRVREAARDVPVPGSTVTIVLEEGAEVVTVKADNKGEFSAWLRAGVAAITAEASGFAPGNILAAVPGPLVEVALDHGASLTGRVIDATSKAPIANARVEAMGVSRRIARTDDDGRFELERLAAGRYQPRALARGGYGVVAQSVVVGAAEAPADIVIEMHVVNTIEGRLVLAGSKKPCTGGEVTLRNSEDRSTYVERVSAQGEFSFGSVPDGSFQVTRTCANGATSIDNETLVVTASMEKLEWEVPEGGVVSGVVVGDDNQPLVGARVVATGQMPPPQKGPFRVEQVTDGNGAFSLAGLVRTKARLSATAGGFAPLEPHVEVDVTTGDQAEVRITMKRGGSLEGAVVDEANQPIAGYEVRADSAARGRSLAVSRDDGTFAIKALPAAEYRLSVRMPTGEVTSEQTAIVRDGEPQKVRLVSKRGDGEIAGTVTDSTGTPVPYAYVRATREIEVNVGPDLASNVHRPLPSARDGGVIKRVESLATPRMQTMTGAAASEGAPSVQCDANGAFTIKRLVRGRYTVHANRPGVGGEIREEHVETGATGVVLSLPALTRLEGVLSMPDKARPPDRVWVHVHDGKAVSRHEELFKTQGAFIFEDLPEGEYRISATSGDWTAAAVVTLPSTLPVTLELNGRTQRKGHGHSH